VWVMGAALIPWGLTAGLTMSPRRRAGPEGLGNSPAALPCLCSARSLAAGQMAAEGEGDEDRDRSPPERPRRPPHKLGVRHEAAICRVIVDGRV
jgi:hypothetical protein